MMIDENERFRFGQRCLPLGSRRKRFNDTGTGSVGADSHHFVLGNDCSMSFLRLMV